MSPLRAVLVGCGSMSRAWLEACAAVGDGLAVVGLVDLVPEAAEARRAQFGLAAEVGTDLDAMLDRTGADLVFNCTVPAAHHPVTLAALARGCHVLGEKPLAENLEQAREMIAAARAADRLLAVTQNRRRQSRIRRLRDFLRSGAIGPVTTLNGDFFIGAHFGGFRDRMRHPLLLDMAIHTFDQARFLTGEDPVAVYCRAWNPAGSWYDHEAAAVCVFEMTGGVVFTYRGSWCAEGLNTAWDADWRIVGARGSVAWDGESAFRAEGVAREGGFRSELSPLEVPAEAPDPHGDGHLGLIREFLHCVRTGAVPETAAADNIKSLAMVMAAIESAETGRRVAIPAG
jgi:predicted dehydrogenase